MKLGVGMVLGIVSGAFAAVSPAWAGGGNLDAIYREDNSAWLSLGGSYLDYTETAGGATQDTETGAMTEVRAGVGLLTPPQAAPLLRNLYLRFEGGYVNGSTNYDGALQNLVTGAKTPYTSTTDNAIWTMSGRVGRALPLGQSAMLIPFAELGYRHWDRNLTGPYGYDEVYQNWDMMAGLMLQMAFRSRWVVSANAAIGSTFNARMDTGGTQFPLSDALAWRMGAELGYQLSPRLEIFSAVDVSKMGFGASPTEKLSTYYAYEPDSTTYETSFRVGAAYHF
jgi:hypothetical protein